MSNQKMKPCPTCARTDLLDVYTYESGWRYVECDNRKCSYRGPGAGSIKQAIKLHNEYTKEPRHD